MKKKQSAQRKVTLDETLTIEMMTEKTLRAVASVGLITIATWTPTIGGV